MTTLTALPFDMPEVDIDLIRRLDRNGPRYTSYPTADRFVEAFNAETYAAWAKKRNIGGTRPLSLYFHLPFCSTLCFYCACNKIITKDKSRADKYVQYLIREIKLQHELFQDHLRVEQLHWGGGTPTFLTPEQMTDLMEATRSYFQLAEKGEYSIEIDPRTVSVETIGLLRSLGFNRLSLGIQDFDPQVQKAVHRIQSEEQTLNVMSAARQVGFQSISIDLIYGLPLQTPRSFSLTLDKVIAASPDRISIYGYAHLPTLFKPQQRIHEADLPDAEKRLSLLKLSIEKLTAAGYAYIGMDHFAKAQDELTIAQQQGRLHRNFQGYSTHADCDLIGMGVTAIGKIGPTYSQNCRTLDAYYHALDCGVLPIMRGLDLSADDLLRRAIIQTLMCQFEVDIPALEMAYLINFKLYFAREMAQLLDYQQQGLLELSKETLTVTPKGRLLIRNICMVFDKYFQSKQRSAQYSKAI